MSNRFYVNDVQIYGNNEMFQRTKEELTKQGAKWNGGTFGTIEITDPQALMDVVTKDSLEYLKDIMTNHYDPIKEEDVEKTFDELTDIDALSSLLPKELLSCIYEKDGEPNLLAYRRIENWIANKRVMTPYLLWTVIKDDVDYKEGKLVLKEGHSITAVMY